MSTLLKDKFSPELIKQVAQRGSEVLENFSKDDFIRAVLNPEWENFELKERYHFMAKCLREQLSPEYKEAVRELVQLSNSFKENKLVGHLDLVYFFLPAVIEDYGGEHFEVSVWAMERVTQLISCEFAVRQFFISEEKKMLEIAFLWSQHQNYHVRRLASEGCRPVLPWGQALISFKENPLPILPILENLMDDESLFVRKSVANNLNDISKTHPGLVVQYAKKWKDYSLHADWVLKHGCRTLLKQGLADILPVFGYSGEEKVKLQEFRSDEIVSRGKIFSFEFKLKNPTSKEFKIRVEFDLYFLRQNNSHNVKTFMISDGFIASGETIEFIKTYNFKPISTRKYYAGKQYLVVKVNGREMMKKDFVLM